MKITNNSMVLMMLALGLATLTGCISFGGKAVEPLPEARGEANQVRPLTAREISDKALEAEKRRQAKTEAGVVFTFQRKVVINEVEGKKERLKTRTYQSFSDHRDPVLLLIDGKIPTPEQVEKERKEIHKHQIKIMGSGESKEDSDRKGDANLMVRNIEKHRGKFIPHLIGTETINGRPAYILQFLHDPEKRFKEAMANEVLKHVLIKIWIDQKEFQFAKFDVELANPLFALGGLAGTVKTFKLTTYQKRLTPEIWADWKVSTRIHIRVLWETHIINFTSESTEFKPLPKTK